MSIVITSEVEVLPPVCDKFAVTLNCYDLGKQLAVVQALWSMWKKFSCAFPFRSKLYKDSYSFDTYGLESAHLKVQASPYYIHNAFLRVEWNPRRADAGNIVAILNEIVPGGYKRLFTHGICTRFDVAVDLVGVDIEYLLVWTSHTRVTRVFSKNGRLQTYELGAKSGRTRFVVYDGVAAGSAPKSNSNMPVTRVEGRFRSRFALGDKKATNPGIMFYRLSLSNYPMIGADPLFECFLESCRFRGTVSALQRLDKKIREQMEKRLNLYSVPWWNPQAIHKATPGLLIALQHATASSPSNNKCLIKA